MRSLFFFIGVGCLLMILLLGLPALAQDNAPIQTIQSMGEATLDVPSDTVEFMLEQNAAADAVYSAIESISDFSTRLGEALAERELTPLNIQTSGISVNSSSGMQPAAPPMARVSAQVFFKSARFAVEENGLLHFASLCDDMRDAAAALQCNLSGPFLHPAESEATENAAIAKAIENAYGHAKASADIMPGQIISVRDVDIQSVAWNTRGDWDAEAPSLGKLSCKVKVRVTYQFTLSF